TKCARRFASGRSGNPARMTSRRSSPCVGGMATAGRAMVAPAIMITAVTRRFQLTARRASVRIRRRAKSHHGGSCMMRSLACSATLTVSLILGLTACGGGPSPAPQVTTTTVAASAGPTTTISAEKAEEGEEAAPLLAWADGNPEEGQAPLTVEFKADVEGGTAPLKYTW